MIKAEDLTKTFGSYVAVDHLSFEINRGEVVGFLGANGAGKTTTMRLLTGFFKPSSGKVEIAGFSVADQAMQVKRRIGYLPETPPLYPEMTVHEYMTYVAALKQVESSKRTESVQWALKKCGLTDRQKSLIHTLSKGLKQRVGIAQAIVHRPEVIILDEPTVGLDPIQIREIRTLVQELAGEHTILLSTHILSEVKASCTRVLLIDQGRILRDQNIGELPDNKSLEELFIDLVASSEERNAS